MFRNIFTLVLIGFGVAMFYGDATHWAWPDRISPSVGDAVRVCYQSQPLFSLCCFFLAVALQMTKKVY